MMTEENNAVDVRISGIPKRYTILQELGSGAHGVVYLAKDELIPSVPIALKLYPRGFLNSSGHFNSVLQELVSLSAVDHQHVVTMYDIIQTDDHVGFTMEYLSGRTLRHEIAENSLTSIESKTVLLMQLCGGLGAIHHKDIVHRDVKPENILLRTGDIVKLGDLGIASPRAKVERASGGLTEVELVRASEMGLKTFKSVEGSALGTIGYMAPEMLLGQPYDQRVDVYALGVVAYELFSGKHPFQVAELGLFGAVKLQLSGKYIPLQTLVPNLNCEVIQAIANAMSASPSTRPASVVDLRTALYNSLYRKTSVKQITCSELIPARIPSTFSRGWDALRKFFK